MTEDQQKEAISKEFLRVLANAHGFKVFEPTQDHGVDMVVSPVSVRVEPNGRLRYLDSQFRLDFQLKATTPLGIMEDDDQVRYDLAVKNYNDLIARRKDPLPLHLLVVVLKAAPPICINMDEDQLCLLGQAYWYLPDENAQMSNNQQQIRITIPKVNRVHAHFVRQRFEELGIEL